MFSSADKVSRHAGTVQRQQADSLFARKHSDSFFGGGEKNSANHTFIQPKLNVSHPDDPQEKEADRMANKVMTMPEPGLVSRVEENKEEIQRSEEEKEIQKKEDDNKEETVQREEEKKEEKVHAKLFDSGANRSSIKPIQAKCAGCADEKKIDRKNISIFHSDIIQRSSRGPPALSETSSFSRNLQDTRGTGTSLPSETQTFMETRFHADFGRVRVHTGETSVQMNKEIHAQAFTSGSDIYFNRGKFSPSSSEGKTLLAHELTHTIQQGASNHAPSSQGTLSTSRASVAPKNISSQKIIQRSAANFPEVRHPSKTGASGIRKIPVQQNIIQPSSLNESLIAGMDLSGKSGGAVLSTGAKEFLQDYYKTNLSDIRLHTDSDSVALCKSLGVRAITQGRNIFLSEVKFDPESEQGAILLSEQISKSLKQRGINSTGADGNDVSGPAALISQITTAVKENKAAEKNIASSGKVSQPKKLPQAKKAKGKTGKKSSADGQKKSLSKTGRRKAGDSDGPVIKAVKRNPKKSPATPAEDPAFLKVIGKTKATAKNQKQHGDAETKSADGQKSAAAVPKEAESKAQNRKTDGMGEATKIDKLFDAAFFKAELLKKIESVTPKTLEEATEFKENNKIGEVKNVMGEKVAGEKEATTAPVNQATAQPLQVNDADNKKPVSLPPTNKGAKPPGTGAKDAAPKNKLDGEISMQEQSQSLDQEMKANNVTEKQLTTSNEPTFSEALNAKKGAQQDAVDKPKQFRKEETLALTEAKSTAQEESAKSLTGMHGARGKNFDATVKHQQTAKQKDEAARAGVVKEIEAKYAIAEGNVTKALDEADKAANEIFDNGSESASREFENYVDERMREYKRKRYSGFWGGLKWAKDKLFGMPDAVNVFYTEGRKLYLKKMDTVITDVANAVTTKLNEAKQAIVTGKKEIDDYVKTLSKDLIEVGKEAAGSIQDKFDSLEQSVNDKRNDLIDGLAKKYVDNVKKLDDRIGELKEANKGLVAKAIGFLKKVWKVIKDLVNLFTTIFARLASIIGVVMNSPSGFFDNLGKAFKRGFNNFKDKFLDYLEKGLMDWLATNLGIAGIELPEKFSPASIFALVLQVLGITKQHIRERAVVVIGERKVKLLESAGGLLYRIYNEGLGALWDMIYEKLTDFKDIIWEAIKSFIKKKIIEAAIMFLLSLLNPIGAFIKLCMAIYDFLMMLVRFKDRIIELLDTILNAVTDVASGAIDGAANQIEKAFAKSIPVIIGFLAALLHLNDIAASVRNIITRIRTRVDKAIDWVIKKAYSLVGKLVEGALRLQDKGTAMIEKGKQAVIGAGKKVLGWLGLKKSVNTQDGVSHNLYFSGSGETAVLMIATTPMPVKNYMTAEVRDKNGLKDSDIAKPMKTAGDIEKLEKASSTDEAKKITDMNTLLTKLAEEIAALPMGASGTNSSIMYGPLYHEHGSSALVAFRKAPFTPQGSSPMGSSTGTLAKMNIRKQGGSPYYIKGHLLNDNLGGPGTTWQNLTPINSKANSDHKTNFENPVKEAVNGKLAGSSSTTLGYMKGFSVVANYGRPVPSSLTQLKNPNATHWPPDYDVANWDDNDMIDILENEMFAPTNLVCRATIKKKGAASEEQVSYTVQNTIGHGEFSGSNYQLGLQPKVPITLAEIVKANAGAKTAKEMAQAFKSKGLKEIGEARAESIYIAFKNKGSVTNGKADMGIGLVALNRLNKGKLITSGTFSGPWI